MFDIAQHYKVTQLKVPVAVTGSSNSTAVEVDAGVGEDMAALLDLGACGADATDKIDIIIEGSADNSTFGTVATFSQILGTATGGKALVGFKRGLNRFFRAKWTVTSGNAPTFVIGVDLLEAMAQESSGLNSATVSAS